ncbi:MAG: polysaccharide pyruvyl transferase family protein [Fibrobacter sp.]|nr:polysaccharide pyruvyl transferase family protein [Fibrobacter sp.]
MKNVNKLVGGVIIMHPNHNNYGTSLQGLATIKVIESLGYNLRIIRYRKKRTLWETLKILPGLLRSGALSSIISSRRSSNFKKRHPEYSANIDLRTSVVNEFKKKYFEPLCDYYTGWRNLTEGSKNYDIIFVGSDQVWGPLSLYAGFYNLLFVDSSIPQFSYSSSFGKSFILSHQKKGVAAFLNKMDAIGVREIRGKEIVEELTNKKATVVADPTLLLSREEWKQLSSASKKHISGDYILCYMLGPRLDNREAVTSMAKQLGMKLVVFRHMDWYEPADENFGDESVYDADCLDFINLLEHAAYVVTDSFHCSVFSIIFHKKFLTFYRIPKTDKQSSHSRIDSLMSIAGLSSQVCSSFTNLANQINNDIDWNTVDARILEYKDKSMEFLKNSLEIRR